MGLRVDMTAQVSSSFSFVDFDDIKLLWDIF